MYADDQFINQQSMKMNFTDIGILDQLVLLSDGQEVVDYFDQVLEEVISQHHGEQAAIQPISLLLLDIDMPRLTGMEACALIKKKFEQINAKKEDQNLQ